MLKQEMILDPLMLGLANINEWCVKGLELSGECGRVIYELGGMKPGPRSFWRMLSVSFRRNGLEPDSIPLNNFHEEREREREREREKREKTVLFWFGHA